MLPFLSLFLLVSVLIGPIPGTATEQNSGWSSSYPREGGRAGGRFSSVLDELREREKNDPTTADTVEERYQQLVKLVRSDFQARRALPRNEMLALEEMVRSGNYDAASAAIHDLLTSPSHLSRKPEMSGSRPERRASFDRDASRHRESRHDRGVPPGPEAVEATAPSFHANIHHLATGTDFANILKLHRPAIDPERGRLYVSGTKTFALGIIDTKTDRLIDTVDLGIPGGFLLNDPDSANLYLYDIPIDRYFLVDPARGEGPPLRELPRHMAMPGKDVPEQYGNYSYLSTGYPFKAGYLQDENAAYAVIEVRDTTGRVVDRILHGPDAVFFVIDHTSGKLYAANTGDASISVFDLKNNRRKIKDITVGTSVDALALRPDGRGLYIRNRLGGSTIFSYDPVSGGFRTIPNENSDPAGGIGMWPTEIIVDNNNLYVLSHYGGRIDVIDTGTDRVVRKIELDLRYKPRMDCISTMVMDKRRGILYAAFPELGTIVAVDAQRGRQIAAAPSFRSEKGGPARIVLAKDESANRLFVYVPDEKLLSVLDGTTLKTITSKNVDIPRMEDALTVNHKEQVLYAGNLILDLQSLNQQERFSKGELVVAIDHERDLVYLKDFKRIGKGRHQETIYEYDLHAAWAGPKRQWILAPVHSIPSSVILDSGNKRLYVGYFETAEIQAFDL